MIWILSLYVLAQAQKVVKAATIPICLVVLKESSVVL